MSRIHAAILLSMLIMTVGATCNPRNVANTADKVAGGAAAVSPFLPPPFNWILAGVGGLAGLIGSHYAGKVKVGAVKASVASGGTVAGALAGVSPITKILSERKWLYPSVGAAISVLDASGVLPMTAEELAGTLAMLALPTIGEFTADARLRAAVADPQMKT